MLRRPALVLALALCVSLPALSGCTDKDLVETNVPGEGIELRYALEQAQTFDGHIYQNETISMRGQPMNRSIEFSVQLVVTEVDEAGQARVAATVSNIQLNWVIPGYPISMAEFNRQAKARLEGVTIRFAVDPMGKVSDVPPAPSGLQEAEVAVLDSIIEGLTSAFFIVPDERLQAGGGWEKEDTRGREGKLGKYTKDVNRGTLVGAYEHKETAQQLAKLKIDGDKTETTTTKDGSSQIRTRSDVEIMWDLQGNYLVSLQSTRTRTQGASSTTVKFDADWTRTIAGSSAGAGSSGTAESSEGAATSDGQQVVQSGSDPCGDDYVGPDECLDPCSVNYMGDAACEPEGEGDAAAPTEGEGAAAAPAEGEGEPAADDAIAVPAE